MSHHPWDNRLIMDKSSRWRTISAACSISFWHLQTRKNMTYFHRHHFEIVFPEKFSITFQVVFICVDKSALYKMMAWYASAACTCVTELGQHGSVVCSTPSQYLNQWWQLFIDLMNRFQWKNIKTDQVSLTKLFPRKWVPFFSISASSFVTARKIDQKMQCCNSLQDPLQNVSRRPQLFLLKL